ncbi:hypothetical protein PMPD1_4245 [Paramixta manurensis]|uniref:Fe-S metabolism associated domain-containing protein n=1 Tax=Paramixta manurensis TaxID=2740817 RepID=A0A6M8UE52_9GAMM|nr:hypothetical protein PMPD1_4245 [Erwiniaceae bacterium PD-1]
MKSITIPDNLIDLFSQCDTLSKKYITIMLQAPAIPPIPDGEKAKELFNCQNVAYVFTRQMDKHTLYFAGDSDSILIKGLMSIMFTCINYPANRDITRYNIARIFQTLGIEKHYEESLPMGLGLVVDEVESALLTAK